MIGMHLALRAGKEHRSLQSIGTKDSQLSFAFLNGERVVVYKENLELKTNQGGLRHRKIKPKEVTIYPGPIKECCPVGIILKYHSKLPGNRRNNALYLRPKEDPKLGDVWYYDIPIGLNKLQGYVKEMCAEAGFVGKETNHSLRSTLATRMYDAGVNEQTICAFTGHRSNAVRSYKRINDNLKCKAASTLTSSQCKNLAKQQFDHVKLTHCEH